MAKVSIIVPVYNVENYLEKCVDSLLSQTIKDIEIILINDGSTDNSLSVLEEYAKKDSRIKIINQENQGQGVARNNALEIAGGDYIGFADPDDWVSPNMFERMYNTAIKYDCDLVEESYYIYNEVRNYTKKRKNKLKLPKNEVFDRTVNKDYLFSPNLAIWNKLYKKELIKNNNIKFFEQRRGEDIIFTLKSRVYADKIVYIDDADYYYRIKKGDKNKKYNQCSAQERITRIVNFCNKIKNSFEQDNSFEPIEKEFNVYFLREIINYYKTQKADNKRIIVDELKELVSDEIYDGFLKKAKRSDLLNNIFSVYNTIRDSHKYKIFKFLGFEIKIPYNKV